MHNEIELYMMECVERTMAARAKRRFENLIVYAVLMGCMAFGAVAAIGVH